MTSQQISRSLSHLRGTSAEPPAVAAAEPEGLSLILITYNREDDIRQSLASLEPMAASVSEIIVVNNASTDGTSGVLRDFAARLPNLRVIEAEANLGVAGGRNRGMRAARGGILVFLDDDAEFLDADFAARIAARFAREPGLGALGLRIVDGEGNMRPNEFPHPDKSLPRDREFYIGYFVGAGHAIRRTALDAAGLYPEEFFYSQEEPYLCAALIEAGYRIAYFPEVTVRHWQSGAGRFVSARKWFLLLRNTLLMNHRVEREGGHPLPQPQRRAGRVAGIRFHDRAAGVPPQAPDRLRLRLPARPRRAGVVVRGPKASRLFMANFWRITVIIPCLQRRPAGNTP
jgi:GT2 family glycosyltransferase